MLLVCGLVLIVIGIGVSIVQASTGLPLVVVGLLMFAMGYDLNAIRNRLPAPPKSLKQLQREHEQQARSQKSAQLAEEDQAAKLAQAEHAQDTQDLKSIR